MAYIYAMSDIHGHINGLEEALSLFTCPVITWSGLFCAAIIWTMVTIVVRCYTK